MRMKQGRWAAVVLAASAGGLALFGLRQASGPGEAGPEAASRAMPVAKLPDAEQAVFPAEAVLRPEIDGEMRETLAGLDRLFTGKDLAFKSAGILARALESLEDYRTNPMLGLAKLERALKDADAPALRSVFAQFKKKLPPAGEAEVPVYRLLFRSWGNADGAGAMDAVMAELPANAVRLEAGREALGSWGLKDPASAARKAESLPETYGKDYLIYSLPYFYIQKDPRGAIAWANALPPSYRRTALLHSVIGWWETDAQGMQDYAVELAQKPGYADEGNGVVFSRVAGELARRDLPGALQWLDRIPESGHARAFAMLGIVDWWGLSDPEKASAWLLRFKPSEETDPAIDHFARDVVRIDPEGAARWGRSLSSPALRNACLKQVLASWAEHNASDAQHWARENGFEGLMMPADGRPGS
jgi:hypothetical protein